MRTKQDVERILTENFISALLGPGAEKDAKKLIKKWHPEFYSKKAKGNEDKDSEEEQEAGT
jgi:hypothetical protein